MEHRHSCAEECDFPSECRWAARLSPGTKAAKTGIVSPVVEESEEGIVDAELYDAMDDALDTEMEKEPPSPSSPVSPTFSIGDKSPNTPASPTSPRESGSLLEKLILSTERRKSRDLTPAVVEAKAERGAGVGLAFPVLDFQSFKAGMDRAHGWLPRGPKGAASAPTGGEDPELMDVDSWVPLRRMGGRVAREPAVGVIGDGRKEGGVMEVEVEVTVVEVEVVEAGGRFIDVMPVGAPPLRSPRRGACDWGMGGLGTAMAFADAGLDFELVG